MSTEERSLKHLHVDVKSARFLGSWYWKLWKKKSNILDSLKNIQSKIQKKTKLDKFLLI